MGEVKWSGATSTDPDTTSNWSTGAVPTSSDDVIFDSTSDGNRDCNLSLFASQTFTWKSMEVKKDFTKSVIFGGSTVLTIDTGGLTVARGAWLDASASGGKIAFTGAAPFTDKNSYGSNGSLGYYIKILGADSNGVSALDDPNNNNGMFSGSSSASLIDNTTTATDTPRGMVTFQFTPQPSAKLAFMNGVYPNIIIVNPSSGTATISPTYFYTSYDITQKYAREHDNKYGKVRFRNLTIPSNVTVSPASKEFKDYNAAYELGGSLSISSSTFDWGYSTVEFLPVASTAYFPVNGETNYGASKKFNASYYNVVILPGPQSNYAFYIRDGMVLSCNSLRVLGGKIYASANYGSTSTAEIHTIERPEVTGDWNFQQIADGIYRARGTTPKAGVPSGGTGQEYVEAGSILYGDGHNALTKLPIGSAGQVLTVSSGAVPEWTASSTGGSGCGLLDIGSLTNDQDVTIEMGNLVCSS